MIAIVDSGGANISSVIFAIERLNKPYQFTADPDVISKASLADAFPDSRLRLDGIGGLFGESAFGPVSQVVTAALEAGLFASLVVAAMVLADRRRARRLA